MSGAVHSSPKVTQKSRELGSRDVFTGATGATAVAPKFSDTLTLFQPGGADSAPTSQRSHQKIACDYISDMYQKTPEKQCTGFSYIGPKLYNVIPKDIKEAKTADDFKDQLKGWIWKNIH